MPVQLNLFNDIILTEENKINHIQSDLKREKIFIAFYIIILGTVQIKKKFLMNIYVKLISQIRFESKPPIDIFIYEAM